MKERTHPLDYMSKEKLIKIIEWKEDKVYALNEEIEKIEDWHHTKLFILGAMFIVYIFFKSI